MPNHWKKAGRILAWNGIVLVLLLGLVELFFGSWLSPPNEMRRLNIPSNVDRFHDASALYQGGTRVRYIRDQYGLRGNYPSPADINLLTIGGSTTDQRYIDEEATWQSVLARRFADSGRDVSVANAGIDGHSSIGHLAAFEHWFPKIPDFQPSYCLFYIGINDFYLPLSQATDRLTANPKAGWWPLLKEQVRYRSSLYYVYRTIRYSLLARTVGINHRHRDVETLEWTTTPAADGYDQLLHERLSAYERRLHLLVDAARSIECEPVFVTQPYRAGKMDHDRLVGYAETTQFDGVELNGLDLYLMMRQYNEATRRAAERANVRLLDAAAEIAWTDADFYDFVHNTPAGARKLGEYFYARLSPLF